MTDLTLPGDIPGLLRRGSPVVHKGVSHEDVVMFISDDSSDETAYVAESGEDDGGARGGWEDCGDLLLDLSDPTGRAHAAWWVRAHHHGDWGQVADAIGEVWTRCELAHRWSAMGVTVSDEQIDILRRIVLHVAGREVTHG